MLSDGPEGLATIREPQRRMHLKWQSELSCNRLSTAKSKHYVSSRGDKMQHIWKRSAPYPLSSQAFEISRNEANSPSPPITNLQSMQIEHP
ncbi:hypothetical protein ACTXT7_017391 [Hymenolepis weldensis]